MYALMRRLASGSNDRMNQREQLERFQAMGLDGNPFRVQSTQELAHRFVDAGPQRSWSAADVVASPTGFVQIVGERGFGKSITLAAIEDGLVASKKRCRRTYLGVGHDGSFVEPAEDEEVCLIDEAQRLDREGRKAARRWLAGGDRRLIVTTHEDLARAFGKDVETRRVEPADAHLIAAMFQRRIETCGGDPERFRLAPAAAKWLATRSGGCMRDVVSLCFKVFETLSAEGARVEIGVRDLERAYKALKR